MGGAATSIATDFTSVTAYGRASTEPEVCAAYTVGGVTPSCVLRPSTPEEAAQLLRRAADRGLAVIPWGNGTKIGIGAPPQRYDAALSLRDLNRTTYYEPDDLVVSVEPGMTFGALQQMLAERRLWLPLDPAGGQRATIGGILAANSAGPLRLRYGGPRDMVLGMKIATTEGKIVKTGGRVVKNVAGYDLAKLLIGSHGTLGVIVEATFKLYPQISMRATWAIEVDSLAAACEFRRRLLASHLRPLRAVLLNAAARAWLESGDTKRGSNTTVAIWIEAGGTERVIARYEREMSAVAAQVNASMKRAESSEADDIWNGVADFGNRLASRQRDALVLKAALAIAAAEKFFELAERESPSGDFKVAGVGQLGVGMVEIGLIANPESRAPSPENVEKLRRLVANLGGGLIVTHCPIALKSKIDAWGPPGDDFEIMQSLKAAWDPKSTLAPGRFVSGL
jgi:glycolate oxidase FAD binding subunit